MSGPIVVAGSYAFASGTLSNGTGMAYDRLSSSIVGPPGYTGATQVISPPPASTAADVTGVGAAVAVAGGAGTSEGDGNVTGTGAAVAVAGGTGTPAGGGAAAVTGVGAAVTVAGGTGAPSGGAGVSGVSAPVTVAGGAGTPAGSAHVTGVAAAVNVAGGAGAPSGAAKVTGIAAPVTVQGGVGAATGGFTHVPPVGYGWFSAYPGSGNTDPNGTFNGSTWESANMADREVAAWYRYYAITQSVPTTDDGTLTSAGRFLVMSQTPSFTVGAITYADVTAGTYDTDLTAIATGIAALSEPTLFVWQHEMELSGDSGYGTAAQFIASFQHVANLMRANAPGKVAMCWVCSAGTAGTTENYYPGDAYVDWIGVDPYDPTLAKGSPTAAYTPFITYLNTDPLSPAGGAGSGGGHGKPLGIFETGVDQPPTNTDANIATWINAIPACLESLSTTWGSQYQLWQWFNASGTLGNTEITPGSLSASALANIGASSFFNPGGANVTGAGAGVTAAGGAGTPSAGVAVTGVAAAVAVAGGTGTPHAGAAVTGTGAAVAVAGGPGTSHAGVAVTGTGAAVVVAGGTGAASAGVSITGIAAQVTVAGGTGVPAGTGGGGANVTGVAAAAAVAGGSGTVAAAATVAGAGAAVTGAGGAGSPSAAVSVTGSGAHVTVSGGAGTAGGSAAVTGAGAPVLVSGGAGVPAGSAAVTGTAAAVIVTGGAGALSAAVSTAGVAALVTITGGQGTPHGVSGGLPISAALLGGTITPAVPYAGTITTQPYGGTITPATYGGTITTSPYAGTITGGIVGVQSDLQAIVGNDSYFYLALTYNGAALNLTGYTVKAYLKATRLTPDADAVVFTSGSGLTITNVAGGLVTWDIPHADLPSPSTLWYRFDVIDASSEVFTALYGNLQVQPA